MDEAGLVAALDPRNGPRQPPSAGSPSGFKHGFNGLKRIKRIGADEPSAKSAPIRLIRFNPLNPCKIFIIAPQSDNYSRSKRHNLRPVRIIASAAGAIHFFGAASRKMDGFAALAMTRMGQRPCLLVLYG
jgi:hypothetical protein